MIAVARDVLLIPTCNRRKPYSLNEYEQKWVWGKLKRWSNSLKNLPLLLSVVCAAMDPRSRAILLKASLLTVYVWLRCIGVRKCRASTGSRIRMQQDSAINYPTVHDLTDWDEVSYHKLWLRPCAIYSTWKWNCSPSTVFFTGGYQSGEDTWFTRKCEQQKIEFETGTTIYQSANRHNSV